MDTICIKKDNWKEIFRQQVIEQLSQIYLLVENW